MKRVALIGAVATLLVALGLRGTASATVTTGLSLGDNLGPIADGGPACGTPGTQRDVHFNVTGVTAGTIQDVSVRFDLSPAHTSVGDLDARLIAPDGTSHQLFGRVGATTPTGFGDQSDLAGPISFSDDAPASPTLWQAAASTTGAVPSSSYRASTIGGSSAGGQQTLITPIFAQTNMPNGLWTLRFRDFCPGDTGTVGSALLTIRHGSPPPPPGQVLLHDNGPLATGPTTESGVAAPAGAHWSELQHPAGDLSEANRLIGEEVDTPGENGRVADDFTVPAGETWTIESLEAYGLGSVPTLPAPGTSYRATLQIWDGPPSTSPAGLTKLFGDPTTNRLVDLDPVDIYRIRNTVAPAATTPDTRGRIWRNTIEVEPPLTLPPGTYWAEWSIHAGPDALAPFVTTPGARGTPHANGRHYVTGPGVWAATVDGGDPFTAPDYPQDYAFSLRGSRVLDPPQPPPTGNTAPPETTIDTTPPLITGLRLTPKVFRVTGGRGARASASAAKRVPKGTTIRVRASEPMTVRLQVQRARPGRRLGKRCVTPRRAPAKARRCTRFKSLKAFSRRVKAGQVTIGFSGRIGQRKLEPARYRLVATGVDRAGNRTEKQRRAPFTIVR